MNILIACIHYPIASGRYIARAFRRLGHSVRTVGPAMGPAIWGGQVDAKYIWEPDLPVHHGASLPTWEDLRAGLGGWQPDLVITADSAYTILGTLPCPHVLWGVDNHVRDYRLGAAFDYLFLAHKRGARIGEPNVIWLPCAYDPDWHVCRTPIRERYAHAAMVGVVYAERAALVNRLGEEFRVLAGMGALLEDYTDVYNHAVVSVCKSAAGDVGQRIFETAAMGCVILSDPCHDFGALDFQAGVQYLEYRTPEEAAERMHELFASSDERIEELGRAAREWALPHTWDARAQAVLNTVSGER